MAHPQIPHGAVRIAFTPDEEVGRGADHFDVSRFGAVCAYTLDGGGAGELEYESFSADAITVTFKGFNTHPGYAKGKMVNAIKLAAAFVARLPRACVQAHGRFAFAISGGHTPWAMFEIGRAHV